MMEVLNFTPKNSGRLRGTAEIGYNGEIWICDFFARADSTVYLRPPVDWQHTDSGTIKYVPKVKFQSKRDERTWQKEAKAALAIYLRSNRPGELEKYPGLRAA